MAWVNLFETEAWDFCGISPLFGVDLNLAITVAANEPASIDLYIDPIYGLEHHYFAPSDTDTGTALGYTVAPGDVGASDPFMFAVAPSGGVAGRLFRTRLLSPGLPPGYSGAIVVGTGDASEFGGFEFPPDYSVLWFTGELPDPDPPFTEFTGRIGADWIAFTGSGSENTLLPYIAYFELQVWVDDPPPTTISYNCECDDPNPSRTLAELRTELMVRLGFSAQTASPPPGMPALLNSFLQGAQRMLYRQYNVLRTERFFTWAMEPGVRFYDLAENEDVCTKELDPRMITWAGLSDGDDCWRPLICGIPPECYTRPMILGWPERYEIRQCIEVWPAPNSDQLRLRIKGHFGLEPFTADGDKCTIDDEAVFLFALARAKAHYRHPDAKNYQTDAQNYIRFLTAGAHQTRRYVPGDREWIAPAPPLWIPKEY